MLDVQDLHAYYGKSHILQGVNFSLQEGEVVSLLGRNGVGRSTTVKYCLRHAPAHLSSRRARTINKQGTKGTPHRLTPPLHCSRPPPRAPLAPSPVSSRVEL